MSKNNLRKKLDSLGTLVRQPSHRPHQRKFPDRYSKLAESVDARIQSGPAGSYCLVSRLYQDDYRHGDCLLRQATQNSSVPLSAFVSEDADDQLPLSSLLFLDIETTGLGGTGAVAFLIGCGSMVSDGFQVRQYLLPDYSDEAAMLEDLLAEFSRATTIVTYNGAAFDLPVIRDRMIVNRVATEIELDRHLDLLHPTRRLFRRRLRDCRLTNIESSLFGLERADDIPGYLVPSVYFEWLSTEDPAMIPSVLEHNRLDIVSLLFLAGHFARIHSSRGGVLSNVDDLHSLSRVYGRRKKPQLVSQVFERIGELGKSGLPDDIILYHSLNFKKTGDYSGAVRLWQSLAESESKEAYWANIELAKFYEHKERDIPAALTHARRARTTCPYGQRHRDLLDQRLGRLSLKLGK